MVINVACTKAEERTAIKAAAAAMPPGMPRKIVESLELGEGVIKGKALGIPFDVTLRVTPEG